MENKTSKNGKKLIIQCVILFLMLLVVAFSGQIFAEGDITFESANLKRLWTKLKMPRREQVSMN